ncbi:GPI inositol-deacylase-like protein, partial [Sarcoptes scabiei]
GGVLIQTLLTKRYFGPYLDKIALVLSLATPHSYPDKLIKAIIYDWKSFDYHRQNHIQFQLARANQLDSLNMVSIGGSFNDHIIRPDLIELNTNHYFDRSISTTAIPDVWISTDHLCIVWCNQLVIKLNQMFFDLTEPESLVFKQSSDERQKIIDFHLVNKYLAGEYPRYLIPTRINFSGPIEWKELEERFTRIHFPKQVIRQINYLIRLNPKESIVVCIEGRLQFDMITACSIHQSSIDHYNNKEWYDDQIYSTNLINQMRSVPNSNVKLEQNIGYFSADELLNSNYTHLIIHLRSSQSPYTIIVDRFTTILRHRTINLPNFFETLFGLFESKLIFSKLISQQQLFFRLSLYNFDFIWNSFWATILTTSCYHSNSSFSGFLYIDYHQNQAKMNEFQWPLKPIKGNKLEFKLTRHKTSKRGNFFHKDQTVDEKIDLMLFLEPNCGFDFLIKFSLINAISQLLRHYFSLLIPMISSTLILLLCIQFSNVCYKKNTIPIESRRYRNRFKIYHHLDETCPESDHLQSRSIVFLKASDIMINHHYFLFCAIIIISMAMFSLWIIQQYVCLLII